MRADHYAVLGVPPNASQREIKRAYRRLALQFHPDQRPSRIADILMRRINEAYEVLHDEGRRRAYDAERAARLAKKRRKKRAKEDGTRERRVGRVLSGYESERAQESLRRGRESTEQHADSMRELAAEHQADLELDVYLRERAMRRARLKALSLLALMLLAMVLLLVFYGPPQ